MIDNVYFSIKNQRSSANWLSRPTTNFHHRFSQINPALTHVGGTWLGGNGVTLINRVTLRRSRFVLGWVAAGGYTIRPAT